MRDLREDEVGLWYGYVAMAVHGEDFWKGEGQKKSGHLKPIMRCIDDQVRVIFLTFLIWIEGRVCTVES